MSVMQSRAASNFRGNSFNEKHQRSQIEVSAEDMDSNGTRSNLWSTILSPSNPKLPEIKSNILPRPGMKGLLNIEEEQNNQATERSPNQKKAS